MALIRTDLAGVETDALALVRLPPADDHTIWQHVLGQLKPSSRTTYTSRLRGFAAWLGQPLERLPAVVIANNASAFTTAVIRYRSHLDEAGLAPSTKNVTLASIAWLVAALHQLGRIDWTLKVRGFKAMKYRDTAGPAEESVRAMLDMLRTTDSYPLKAARDEVLVRLAVSLGLRRSEIVQLDVEDVDEGDRDGGQSMRVAVLGKGCDEKAWLTVPPRTARALRTWLRYRATLDSEPKREQDSRGVISERTPLFVQCTHAARRGNRSERLGDEGFAQMLDTLRRRAGIATKVRCHGLRHRSVTSFLQAGGRLEDAVIFARHRDPKTTMIYRDNIEDAAGKAAAIVDGLF